MKAPLSTKSVMVKPYLVGLWSPIPGFSIARHTELAKMHINMNLSNNLCCTTAVTKRRNGLFSLNKNNDLGTPISAAAWSFAFWSFSCSACACSNTLAPPPTLALSSPGVFPEAFRP